MSKTLGFKVVNCKLVSANSLMVFDLAVGYTADSTFVGVMEVRGCWLKQKSDGSGNYVSFPSKLRITREGEAAVDDNGYKIYDNIVDLYMEKGANPQKPDGKAPTQAAWGFRKWLIEEATNVYQELRGSQEAAPARAAAPAAATKRAPRPAAAPTAVADAPRNQNMWDAEEDDSSFPF
jgi:hypothetical protein